MYAAGIFCVWLCCLAPVCGQIAFDIILTDADRAALVSPEVVQQKWTLMISRTKEIIDYAVKMGVSQLTAGGDVTANISSSCIRNGIKILWGMRKLKPWALKFLDASAKTIDGALGFTTAAFGCYDECVNNVVMDERSGKSKNELFRGMYCRVNMKPYLPRIENGSPSIKMSELLKNVSYKGTAFEQVVELAHLLYLRSPTIGICIPSGCSKDDLNQLVEKGGDYMGIAARVTRCETKEEDVEITPTMIGVMAAFSFAGLMLLLGTLISIFCYYTGKKLEGTFFRVLTAFSFIRNFQKLTDTSSTADTLNCLHGIRFLTMAWIIVGHTYGVAAISMHYIREDLEAYLRTFDFQAIASGTTSVDTFFFMAGLLVCYSSTKTVKIGKGKFSVPLYIVHRLWRILPVYAFVIGYTFILPLTLSGPLKYDALNPLLQPCEKNWWASLLFINNFYDETNMCVGQGWYLTVDMQLYIGSLIILLPLMRSAKWGIGIALCVIVAAMISSGIIVYMYNLPPTFLVTLDLERNIDFGLYHYSRPYSHAPVYGVGILTGYLLAMQPKLKIPKVAQLLGWVTSTFFCMCVVYGRYNWNMGVEPTVFERLFFSSCYNTIWGLGIAWIVVCCCTGHGGIVNYILSWKVWIPLSRLTFVAYLAHPHVMLSYLGNLRGAISLPHHYLDVWLFIGHLVISYGVAFAGSMLIEAPFISLKKIIFSKPEGKADPNTIKDGYSVHNGESKRKIAFIGTSVTSGGVVNTQYVQKLEM